MLTACRNSFPQLCRHWNSNPRHGCQNYTKITCIFSSVDPKCNFVIGFWQNKNVQFSTQAANLIAKISLVERKKLFNESAQIPEKRAHGNAVKQASRSHLLQSPKSNGSTLKTFLAYFYIRTVQNLELCAINTFMQEKNNNNEPQYVQERGLLP